MPQRGFQIEECVYHHRAELTFQKISVAPSTARLLVHSGMDPTQRQGNGLTRSSMPSFLSWRTTEPRLERRISGYVCSCRCSLKDFSV